MSRGLPFVFALLLVAACADGDVQLARDAGGLAHRDASVANLDATTMVDAGLRADAPADVLTRDATVTIDRGVEPDERALLGNPGWIGGVCGGDEDCPYEGGRCQLEGMPYGVCTRDCALTCPDSVGAEFSATFCSDGSWAGRPEGMCVSRCSGAVYGDSECPVGFECADDNRYGMSARVERVCVPVPSRGECEETDVLLDLSYPDDGALWIPAEALCSGEVDVLVMLHGINPARHTTPSIGGDGRRLELLVRRLIDHHQSIPLALAEPVHLEAASSTLYGTEFDPTRYVQMVRDALSVYGVEVNSLSVVGHSGAGCDPDNGLYKLARRWREIVPSLVPELRLVGFEDICYADAYHYRDLDLAFLGSDVKLVNMWTSMAGIATFEEGFLSDEEAFVCNDTVFSSCLQTPDDLRYSYRTASSAGVTHDTNPYFFLREVLPRFFARGGP